jgi:hypothetical protein
VNQGGLGPAFSAPSEHCQSRPPTKDNLEMLVGKPVINVWVGVALTFAMLLFLRWLGDYGLGFVLPVRVNGFAH